MNALKAELINFLNEPFLVFAISTKAKIVAIESSLLKELFFIKQKQFVSGSANEIYHGRKSVKVNRIKIFMFQLIAVLYTF